jgi:dinuclear metal center YbgI/SA1388 family protein
MNLTKSVSRAELTARCDALLESARFKDYCPNGLQVEGKREVRKIISGVTASAALIDAAIERGADAIFVHHGLFWRGHDGRLTGWLKERVAKLIRADMNLLAYHLPLDAHASLGNNAQLGERLGAKVSGRFGEQDLGFIGELAAPLSPGGLNELLSTQIARPRAQIFAGDRPIHKLAWCTGGAQGYFESAIAAGADAFVTGEISEPQAHLARECGVHYFACGHHATERYGAPAVAAFVAAEFGIAHEFVDIDNPA